MKLVTVLVCAWLVPPALDKPLSTREPNSPRLRIVEQAPGAIELQAKIADTALANANGAISQSVGEVVLSLHRIDDAKTPGPAMLGEYARRDQLLIFRPLGRLSKGGSYRAVGRFGQSVVEREYHVPAGEPIQPATVARVYPSTDVVPANLLKFYIYFSKPMRETDAIFDQILLLDENGYGVHDPWRRTELWTADLKRLTLWIHPGRVKTGVGLGQVMGPVLKPGGAYELVLSTQIRDADGAPLAKAYRKKFRAGPADRSRPLPADWKLRPPTVSKKYFSVSFPEPLDRALLERFLYIVDDRFERIPGDFIVCQREHQWSFLPKNPWPKGTLRLVVDEQLEDLAGNTPTRLFDTDLTQPALEPPVLVREFKVESK